MAGTYAWPFVEGQARGFTPAGAYQRQGHANFFSLDMEGMGELEIRAVKRQGDGWYFTARPTATSGRQGRRPPRPSEFGYVGGGFSCGKGWLVIEEYDESPEARAEFAWPTRVGAKLAVLEDGSLAIGQWRRLHSRYGSLISWGDQSVGRHRLPDKVTWYWSRYQRLPATN